MIKNEEPLSMSEVMGYVKKDEGSGTEIIGFIKKFVKLPSKDAKELKSKLIGLDLMKIKQEHIVKIIDLLPERAEELNKIFTDVGLDEDESNKILETIKEFK